MPVHAVSSLAAAVALLTALLIVPHNAANDAERIVAQKEAGHSDLRRVLDWRLRHPPLPGGW